MANYTTIAKFKVVARNISADGSLTATMTDADIQQFLDEADSIINSKLSALYYTPLITITRSNDTHYPDPIPYIATRISAGLAVRANYSRIEPTVSENAEAHLKDALRELDDLYNGVYMGSRRLDGQKLKAKTAFLNPYSAPLEQPKGPIA